MQDRGVWPGDGSHPGVCTRIEAQVQAQVEDVMEAALARKTDRGEELERAGDSDADGDASLVARSARGDAKAFRALLDSVIADLAAIGRPAESRLAAE